MFGLASPYYEYNIPLYQSRYYHIRLTQIASLRDWRAVAVAAISAIAEEFGAICRVAEISTTSMIGSPP
jgi:hypothetical protein